MLLFNFKLGFEFQIPITYYWKAINFCVLNYRLPANLLIFSRRTFTFFLHFLRIYYIKIHMIYKQKLLYFFFPVYTYFISFSYFIVLPSTSSTILNRSGWRVHPSLALNLDGKAFSFSQLIISCWIFVDVIYQVKEVSISNLFRVFNHKWVWHFLHLSRCSYNFSSLAY